MTDEEFAALVKRLEESARRGPASYAVRVLALAMLGNAYLMLVLLLIAALFLASLLSLVLLKVVALKIAIPVGIFLWVVLKSLWVKVAPPQGVRLRRKEAPELFSLIDALRRRLRAPRFHQVLITDDFNAGVVQRPRLGIFGWYRNYLLIGLPLMKMLSVGQFTAVLAHEFGHLAKGHGRLSNWIYRQRLRWSQLMRLFSEDGYRGSFLFTPFLNRFAPYFNAYSFPLARANEYEADAASVRATNKVVAAEALTAVHVAGRYLDGHYWPQVYRQADETPQPAFAPYREMQGDLMRFVETATISQWIEGAVQEQTGLSDTHPSLSDRLDALGEQPRFAPPKAGTSAAHLLGPALARLSEQFDRTWAAATAEGWRRRHEEVQKGRQALAQLEQKAVGGEELTLWEAYDRAMLTERYGAGADVALAQFEALQQGAPEDVVLCYTLGVRWLNRDEERGVALVRYAMDHDADAFVPGAEVLRDYYWRTGNRDEAHRWHELMCEHAETDRLAAKERNEVRLSDKFQRHGLSEQESEAVRAALKTIPGLRKAYLVRKRVQYHPERPFFVLGFTVRLALRARRLRAEVQQRILNDVSFPGETLVVSVEGGNYRFGRKFFWMRGSRIL
jgi:Zn-dependent protease with chaperone function